jgi:hypothetical protein
MNTSNTKTEKKEEFVPLSASRIKTFENCSWIYWSNYHIKAPQSTNDGALKGGIVHEIFELLLDKENKPEYDKIIANNSITASVLVLDNVNKTIAALKLPNEENQAFQQINDMILVGLKTDFFVEGGTLVAPEYSFDLTNEEPAYRLKGFMDKPFMKKKEIYIDDFKSSKKKYEGEEISANMQALLYSVAATKIWPKLKPIVRFIFLQFPKDPVIKIEYKKDILKGFEEYLGMIQKKINNFTLSDAKNNFAADKAYGTNTFSGKLLCGMGKYKGAKKKDGSLQWNCPYKWDYSYYAIIKDGKVIRSALTKEELTIKDGEVMEEKYYPGCPRWQNPVNDIPSPLIEKLKNIDILDDF